MSDTTESAPRSTFVTVVAWIFIALAGFATLIAVLQNIMISVMFPDEAMRDVRGAEDFPAFARFMFANREFFFRAFLVLSAATLVSAIGLLKRQNWARIVFIGIMGLGIVWNIGGLVLMFFTLSWMPPMPDHAPPDMRDGFDVMMKVMMGFSVVMALAFAGLFGWIIKRLVSRDIRREFVQS